jgi:uncharacterized protein
MKIIVQDPLTAVLRFDRDEEVLQGIRQYCIDEEIGAATFSGIGAAQRIVLSWYDLGPKEYVDKELEGQWEIASLTGNVSRKEDNAHVHAHGVFSDRSMQAQGGHIKKLVVGATCEVVLTAIEGTMERERDDETGLWLLCEP